MQTITDLTDPIDEITTDNVTSDHKDAIEKVMKDLDKELANENLTKKEKQELEEGKQKLILKKH